MFGINRLDIVNQPIVKARIAVSILALLLLGAGYEIFVITTNNKNLSAEVVSANRKITSLDQVVKGLKESVSKIDTTNEQCVLNSQAANDKIAAFAKQAAICNSLREKLHIPQ